MIIIYIVGRYCRGDIVGGNNYIYCRDTRSIGAVSKVESKYTAEIRVI